jgi:DNA invertase Pin-like site-specific DNA recombinase
MAYQSATKAIILARVSTEEQAEDGHFSIPAQLRNLRDYVERKNLKVIAEHQFNESASKDIRKKFEEAIKIVETTDEPIAIVVDVVDRFQRGYRETVKFDDLRKNGKVELHFVNNSLVIHRNSSPQDLMVWDFLVMGARSYVLQLAANVKRSIREKLQRGEYPGGDLPTGYKPDTTVTEDGRIIRKKVLDEERASFVVKCFRLFVTDRYSAQTLAEKLAKAGFTTKSRNGGKPKSVKAADILNILNNPFYFGKFRYRNPDTGDRELWPKNGRAKNYPILIEDWKLFEQVQKILEKHNSRAAGYKENEPKFKGLLICRFCGHTLTHEEMSRTYKDKDNPNANVVYYHCSSGKMHHDPDWYKKKFGSNHSGVYVSQKGKRKGETIVKCPQLWWKEEEIEQAILEELENITYGEEIFDWFKKSLEGEYEEEVEVLEDQLKSARLEYEENERIVKGLVRSMATENDVELREAFRSEYQELKKKQEDLRSEIKELESAKELNIDSMVDTLRYCSNLRDQYENLDDEKKREFLRVVFSEISPHRGWIITKKGKGRKAEADFVRFFYNEPFATLKTLNLVELDKQWFESGGKNLTLEKAVAKANEEEKKSITKKNKKKASLFP